MGMYRVARSIARRSGVFRMSCFMSRQIRILYSIELRFGGKMLRSIIRHPSKLQLKRISSLDFTTVFRWVLFLSCVLGMPCFMSWQIRMLCSIELRFGGKMLRSIVRKSSKLQLKRINSLDFTAVFRWVLFLKHHYNGINY